MSQRAFTEFLQAQQLPWQREPEVLQGCRTGVEARVLSQDRDTGAASLLLRYPPGWRRAEPEVLTADEELFVLAGSLQVGARCYSRYGYAHLPAGHFRAGMFSAEGAVVLTFFSSAASACPAVQDAAELKSERLVEHVDTLDGDWGAGFHPRFPPGAGRKWLRRDPVTGDDTWILGTMPLRSGRRPERHPVVEEMYLLSGELHGHVGVMRPGAYFWRPPQEWHGPFGSLTGNLMLFRTVGGPLSTEYTEHEVAFAWDPPSQPVLPPELATLTPFEPDGTACY